MILIRDECLSSVSPFSWEILLGGEFSEACFELVEGFDDEANVSCEGLEGESENREMIEEKGKGTSSEDRKVEERRKKEGRKNLRLIPARCINLTISPCSHSSKDYKRRK